MVKATRTVGRWPRATFVVMALAVAGCAGGSETEYVERPATDLYNDAQDALQANEYQQAAGLFDEVERQHPYSPWATKAQLMAAYAFYRSGQYDEAIAALDRFIQLHPANPDVPYAHYLRALCYYEQISDVARDQQMTDDARRALSELVNRYPNSIYARDARIKLDLTYDHLAGKEMVVGRYYLRQGHYLAAVNRFRVVVERYSTTTHVPEALHRLVEAYTALGAEDEAQKVAAVLGHNFPGSQWYSDSYRVVASDGAPSPQEPWYQFW